jgi:regulator of replication initiation timing
VFHSFTMLCSYISTCLTLSLLLVLKNSLLVHSYPSTHLCCLHSLLLYLNILNLKSNHNSCFQAKKKAQEDAEALVLAEAMQKRREEKEARKKLRMEARMVKNNLTYLFRAGFYICIDFVHYFISPHHFLSLPLYSPLPIPTGRGSSG